MLDPVERLNGIGIYVAYIKIKLFFIILLYGIASTNSAVLAQAPGSGTDSSKPPNIIVLLVDDMGWSDIGSYGGEIPTPHLDKLATNGLRFTQFYNTARCSPTRASLLTGQYPHAAGMGYLGGKVEPNSRGFHGTLLPRAVTLADVLGKLGYLTAVTGKWHLGAMDRSPPWERGFSHSLVHRAGGVYFRDQKPRGKKPQRIFYLNSKPISFDSKELAEGNWYSTDLFTRWSIRFIDKARQDKKPFFLYLPYVAPHFPIMAPKEDVDRFRGQYMQGWEYLRKQRFARQKAMGLIDRSWQLSAPLKDIEDWNTLTDKQKKRYDHMMAVYAASIARVDKSVGALVQYLKDTKQFDNTLILFLSDNGGNAESGPSGRSQGEPLGGPASNVFVGMNWAMLQNTPFKMFKHFTHEGGIATPLIAHWPSGIAKDQRGAIVDEPAHLIDIMPTVLEVTGGSYPQRYRDTNILPMLGESVAPVFQGEPHKRQTPIYFEHEGNRAVRHGRWKVVSRLGYPWELYDMSKDRTETKNLIKQHPDIANGLIQAYHVWAQRDFVDTWTDEEVRNDWGGKRIKNPATKLP